MHWQDTEETLLIGLIVCDALRNSGGKMISFFAGKPTSHDGNIITTDDLLSSRKKLPTIKYKRVNHKALNF